ncbi:MAG: tRNA (N(6)-L-threonylcarbamoyladenosine(37)-C(2))-methylthiotransferase [Desulfurococcales archaeon]|nr:tRNA (N(6)-L-threonylcarbamoyladenosine(37)-C(2))-methylthiotransferase [Desulfurococcales archaeon]
MRVYIETYGCALNMHDTLVMEHVLKSRGHEITESLDDAEAVIVNTCAVRLDTERKMQKRIEELARKYSSKKLIVAGCLAKTRPYLVNSIAKTASLVSPQNTVNVWRAVESDDRVILLDGYKDNSFLPAIKQGKTVSTIAISEGCLSNCSFCITKLARRRVSSYPISKIVEAVKKQVEKGVVEIRITAQDTGVYGYDIYGRKTLPDLLEEIISSVEGFYKLRIGMMSPQHFGDLMDRLLPLYRDPHIYKFFHLPVQSGDDRVLKLMNREYTVDEYRSMVKEIRGKIDDAFIATDIIVGHPGEDEEAFNNTVRLVKELRFDRVHIARYTYRPRTYSGKLKQVPEAVKKERSSILSKIIAEIGEEKNRLYLGKTLKVLLVEKAYRAGSLVGRLDNYTPVIVREDDGVTLGSLLKVRVTGYTFFDIRGTPL